MIEDWYQAGVAQAHREYKNGNYRFSTRSLYTDLEAIKWWNRGYNYEIALIKINAKIRTQPFATSEDV